MIRDLCNSIRFIQTKRADLNADLRALSAKTINVAPATCSSFFEKFENTILKFQTNLKLNLQVDNIVIYNRANFQVKIRYSLSYAKMTNSEIYNSEQCRFSKSHSLSEFVIFLQSRILGISSLNFASW
jgi:hypothetical protein